MSLADLTDPNAVHLALKEYDTLGRDNFLSKYGFGRAVSYFVQHEGRFYDSKAIVGAAHGYQVGHSLRATDFSGGDATVAATLARLGFTVVQGKGWSIPIGAVTVRSEIHGEYGGSNQGGIEPSAKSPNVIIYTDPEVGALHGYNYDGWVDDAQTVFDYTGEGQVGDQSLSSRGNAAILNHVQDGRTVRLFKTLDVQKRLGGKRQEYIGGFRIDPANPYRWERALDRDDNLRNVVVFRLLREDVLPNDASRPPTRATQPTDGNGPRPPAPRPQPGGRESGPTTSTRVEMVAPEANKVLEYETSPRLGEKAKREESALVREFETWLTSLGHGIQRARIRPIGESGQLVTDTYDIDAGVLYEAKSKSDRATIRLGVGQILDYLRFLPEARGALLLPSEPSYDLKMFIASCGLGVTYRENGTWVTEEP